jgi:hypothetical protein
MVGILELFAILFRPVLDWNRYPCCGGRCLCHHIGALGGVSCPSECPMSGKRFDGCHRCDLECASDASHESATGPKPHQRRRVK